MKVKKILNNNAIVVNENGEEKIVMGAGIGFQKAKNDPVDRSRIEKVFVKKDRLVQQTYDTPEEIITPA